ncbi:MAG: diguanylate cyclase [Phycisphaerae bacterium]|nr:diguanylate cyclase [Phycisphaerae bacterium]MDD5381286.1 diguanylate cyclase [Phycisphaerae bacterium]
MKIPTVKDIEQAVEPLEILTIKENDTVAQAAKKMTDNQVGCLIVLDAQNKFSGIVTERDMLAKVMTKALSPESLSVRDIMTTDVVSCTTDTPAVKVEQLMAEHKIRHVPIVENGVPIGMVSSRDVIAHQLSNNEAMRSAAEQLAMLPTGLKSLEFEDVVALAINEVPKSFNADRAILCFNQKDSPSPVIYRRGFPPTREKLLSQEKIRELSLDRRIVFGEPCSEICKEVCNQCSKPTGLIIPISICDQTNGNADSSVTMCGFLCMCWHNPDSTGPEELLLYKASLLRDVLNVNLTNAKLYQNYEEARRDSETDPLTGLGTRRVLERVLKAECARAARYDCCFSIAVVDVDNFKQINDTAGHVAGDKVLKLLAKTMRHNVRTTDVIIARYGGDEFVLLMLETKLSGAKVLLERLRRHVKTISLPKIKSVTISCGLAEWSEGPPPDTAETVLKRADDALYEAKHSGRNRVVTACSTTPQE